MATIQKHRALKPFYGALRDSIDEEGSSFMVYAETIAVINKTADVTRLDDELPENLKRTGYTSMRVRVYQGSSPNYTDHEFPLEVESKTQVTQPTSGLSGLGGLAGLGGDPVAIIREELDKERTKLALAEAEKKLAESEKLVRKLKAKHSELKGQVKKLPLQEVLGTSVAATLKGVLSAPAFANTPLSGLLTEQAPHQELQTADPLAGISETARNMAFSFDAIFNAQEGQQVGSILSVLAEEKHMIERVLQFLSDPQNRSQNVG